MGRGKQDSRLLKMDKIKSLVCSLVALCCLSASASTNQIVITLGVDLDTGQYWFTNAPAQNPTPPSGAPAQARSVLYPDSNTIVANLDTTDLARMINTQPAGVLFFGTPIGSYADGDVIIYRIRTKFKQTLQFSPRIRGTKDREKPDVSSGDDRYDYIGIKYNEDSTVWDIIATNFGASK